MEKILTAHFDSLIHTLEVPRTYEMPTILIFILCFHLTKYFTCALYTNNVISLCHEKYRENNFL